MPTVHTCFLLFSGSLKVDSSSLSETWGAWPSVSWKVDDSICSCRHWDPCDRPWSRDHQSFFQSLSRSLANQRAMIVSILNSGKMWVPTAALGLDLASPVGEGEPGSIPQMGQPNSSFSPADSPLGRGPLLAPGGARRSPAGVFPTTDRKGKLPTFCFTLLPTLTWRTWTQTNWNEGAVSPLQALAQGGPLPGSPSSPLR